MPTRTKETVSLPADPLSRLEITAHHEAGHVVADLVLGIRVDEVSIRPNPADGSLGEVRGSAYDFYGTSRADLRRLVKAAVVSLYAGFEAERLVDPHADEEVSATHDQATAFALPMNFQVPPRGCQFYGDDVYEAWMERQRAAAAHLVRAHWDQVRAVATVLLIHEQMSGHEAARAFRDAGGVVHDDLWYLLEAPEAP